MKKIMLVLAFCFITSTAYAEIQITQEQFDNLDVIHQEIKKNQAEFLGFAGTKDKLRVYGISEEEAVKEIKKIKLDDAIIEKEQKEKDKKKADLLDMIGLIEADITKIKNLP